MLINKLNFELLLQNKINEDSLVNAYASLKYANKMLSNADEKGLDSKQYWLNKKDNAIERIDTLKSKGEVETEDTHKQADELLEKLQQKNKQSFKELLSDPELKKHALNFVKEVKNHVSLKSIIIHTSHHFNSLIKPVYNTTKDLFRDPKNTILKLKDSSKEYFSTVFKTIKNTKVIAQNANQAFKDINAKYKTKFSEEEKKELLSDPDKFLSKLSNKLTPHEVDDIKMVTRHALNVATAAMCAQYLGHVSHSISEVSHALMQGLTKASIETCKEVGKEHLIGAFKESFINTSILALDLVDNTAHITENEINNTTEYYKLFSSMVPFIKLYSTNPQIQNLIIQEIARSIE